MWHCYTPPTPSQFSTPHTSSPTCGAPLGQPHTASLWLQSNLVLPLRHFDVAIDSIRQNKMLQYPSEATYLLLGRTRRIGILIFIGCHVSKRLELIITWKNTSEREVANTKRVSKNYWCSSFLLFARECGILKNIMSNNNIGFKNF